MENKGNLHKKKKKIENFYVITDKFAEFDYETEAYEPFYNGKYKVCIHPTQILNFY